MCRFVLHGTRCQQPSFEEGLCRYHWHLDVAVRAGRRPHVDPYYHRKVMAGLVAPSWGGMSDAAARALLEATEPKADGRPTDAYVIPE